jgi:hypothetical protein
MVSIKVVDEKNAVVKVDGAMFEVFGPFGYHKLFYDNSYPRPGRVAVKVGAVGVYTVCETQAPAEHWRPKPRCQTVSVGLNAPAFVGWFIMPLGQVFNP